MRSLAKRAADAARDTSALIEGTVIKVKEGAEQSARTTEAFSQVSDRTSRVETLINEITIASNEQSQGIEQINKAVAEIDQVTPTSPIMVEARLIMVNGGKRRGTNKLHPHRSGGPHPRPCFPCLVFSGRPAAPVSFGQAVALHPKVASTYR